MCELPGRTNREQTQGRRNEWSGSCCSTVQPATLPAFDIGFALPRAPIKGFRKALTEHERRVIAKSIVEHLKLCGWQFQMSPIAVGHGTADIDLPRAVIQVDLIKLRGWAMDLFAGWTPKDWMRGWHAGRSMGRVELRQKIDSVRATFLASSQIDQATAS